MDYNRPFYNGTLVRNYKSVISSFSTNKIPSTIIFGHLMPCKYCDLRLDGFHKRKDYVYVTFLREPLQRAISHYYFWKKLKGDDNPMLKISKESCSLEKFLTYEYFTNFYSKYFFGFPVENFDFIGITENFSSSMNALSKIYSEFGKIQTRQANTNNEKPVNGIYEVEKNLELKFRELNKKDYKIYEKAKKINLKLIHSYNL